MSSELRILKMVAEKLDGAGVPYMVTGSIAANFYTIPRMTRDIDIIIDVAEVDAAKLAGLFSEDFYVNEDAVIRAVRDKRMFNVIHNKELVKVDFIVRKETEYRRLEFNSRKSVSFEGEKIYITSPEDLILSKLWWARESRSEIQIRDVRNLLASVPELNHAYIIKWARNLDLEDIYQWAEDERHNT